MWRRSGLALLIACGACCRLRFASVETTDALETGDALDPRRPLVPGPMIQISHNPTGSLNPTLVWTGDGYWLAWVDQFNMTMQSDTWITRIRPDSTIAIPERMHTLRAFHPD